MKEAINIKGTKQGLVILFDADRDFTDIKAGLKYKMESSRGFFSGAKYTFYGNRKLIPAEINELEAICKDYGLIPDPAVHWPPASRKPGKKLEAVPKKAASLPGDPALLVKRILRSGQVVTHPGHITVLGDVHPGAKVITGGSVLIMGNCSGFIQAGAGGNVSAYILAMTIKEAHLRIANKTLLVAGKQPPGGPVIAQIKKDEMVLMEYQL